MEKKYIQSVCLCTRVRACMRARVSFQGLMTCYILTSSLYMRQAGRWTRRHRQTDRHILSSSFHQWDDACGVYTLISTISDTWREEEEDCISLWRVTGWWWSPDVLYLTVYTGGVGAASLRSVQADWLQRPAAAGGAQQQQPQHQHQHQQRLPLSSENPPIGAVPHPCVVCSQPAGVK